MILAIDIGNTNIHMGLWDGSQWRHNWRARTVLQKMPDEYAVLLRSFLTDSGLDWGAIKSVSIASVVPPLTSAFVELSKRYIGVDALVISAQVNTGIRVDVEQPDQVGADRIVN